MDKDILLKSGLNKTFAALSKIDLDLTYVITTDGSFTVTADGCFVVVGVGGSVKRRLKSLINKLVIYMASIQKVLAKTTQVVKTNVENSRFSKIIIKKSKVKKEGKYDG